MASNRYIMTFTFKDGTTRTLEIDIPNGETGPSGPPGEKGDPGHTPVRGKDYWTETDKTEVINEVVEKIGDGIELTGAKPSDLLMIKVVDENGKPTEWDSIDLLREEVENTIFPTTLMEDKPYAGSWESIEELFGFNIPEALDILLEAGYQIDTDPEYGWVLYA